MSALVNEPCPLLPEPERPLSSRDIASLGDDRGPRFYETSLNYAQCLWREGLPAQALLQLNRAFACCLAREEPILQRWPLPYAPMFWLIRQRREGQFIGNPRRHFQHLATRMVEPNKDLRTWRAWACWYGARALLDESEFPGDTQQIRREGVIEPTFATIRSQLETLSPAGDPVAWQAALADAGIAVPARGAHAIRVVDESGMDIVRSLAHEIWHQVYPGIITTGQIDYMLRQRYAFDVLRADLLRGVEYALIDDAAGLPCGYLAWEARKHSSDAFLHKLYLHSRQHGLGIGAAAIEWVATRARQLGLTKLSLVVNKRNSSAIRAYQRAGFAFEHDVVTDIGDGYVMDDYVMAKRLV